MANGVALAAIQALYRENIELREQLDSIDAALRLEQDRLDDMEGR